MRQKGFVIPGSDGTVNLGAYSEAAEKLWRKARAEAKAAKTKEAPGSPPPGVSRQADSRGNLMFDAQIGALCREHGIGTILTNDRDFARFEPLQVRRLN